MDHQLRPDMRECIENCTTCHNICMETVAHCLQMGGSHAEADHIRTLLDCAEICATSANFMLRGSELHAQVCGVCATACKRCDKSCERLASGDELMLRCAEMCRRCAESCRRMAACRASVATAGGVSTLGQAGCHSKRRVASVRSSPAN